MSRVGYVLNKYPETRNNDKDLAFKLWKEFFPAKIEKLNGKDAVTHKSFLSLPKSYDIQRYRAHIQNDLGLFLATPEIQKGRGQLQLDWHEEMSILKNDCPKISVYSDESGRDSGSLIIGSLWIYDRVQEKVIEKQLEEIQKNHKCKKLKFSKLRDKTFEIAKLLFDALLNFKKVIAFKALVVEDFKDYRNKIFDAYKEHYINSVEYEIEKNRMGDAHPKKIAILKDKEEKIDLLGLESLKRDLRKELTDKCVYFDGFYSLSMEKSVFLQLIDFFCGSINRHLSKNETKNVKDEFASYIFSELNINNKSYDTNADWVQIKVLKK